MQPEIWYAVPRCRNDNKKKGFRVGGRTRLCVNLLTRIDNPTLSRQTRANNLWRLLCNVLSLLMCCLPQLGGY